MSEPVPPTAEDLSPAAVRDVPPRRSRRWRKRVAWSALVSLGLVVVGGVVVTRPFVLTPLLSWQLSSALGVDVSLERAEWSWDGRVDLIGVRLDLAVPASPAGVAVTPVPADAQFDRLIDAKRIAVSLSPAGWLRGDGVLDSIVIDGPVLRVVEDAATGRVNLRQWLLSGEPEPEKRDAAQGVPPLPRQVLLTNGRIVVERRHAGEPDAVTTLADLPIAGRFEPMPDRPGTRSFVIEQAGDTDGTAGPGGRSAPLRIEGTIAREPARIELFVDEFDVAQPLGVLAPRALRAIWTEMNPAGELPTLHAVFEQPAEAPDKGFRLVQAELVLEGLEFSVPLASLGLASSVAAAASAEQASHDLRMTQVSGRFVLADDAVNIEGLTGLIEGVRYFVKGTAGLSADSDTKLQVHTDPFVIAADPPFILRMPRAVRNLYDEYRPDGRFRASAIIHRSPERKVQISGAVEILGASATYHQFTYPLRDITGVITFDENGLAFDNLKAQGPTGAGVAILGQVTNPGQQAKADVTLVLENIPIDEHLYGALNAKAQRAIQMFLDHASLAAYTQEGLIAPQNQANPAGYAFDLDNRARGVVRIVRDLSVAPKSQVQTRIDATGLRLLFEFFPYPLTLTGGAIIIDPQRIELEGLRLEGPAGVSATVVGELRREPGGPYVPDLTVRDMVVPVTDNAYLRAALPRVAREWFEAFVLTGEARGQVRITEDTDPTDDDDAAAWRVTGDLVGGSARPFGGEFVVSDLSGQFVVDREHTALSRMNGRRGAAVLDVSATIEHVHDRRATDEAPATPRLTLSAAATNLAIEPTVLDLIPPGLSVRGKVSELFTAFAPAGVTDVDLSLLLPGDASAGGVELRLRPREVSLTHQGARVSAEAMRGSVEVFGDHARFTELFGVLPRADGGGEVIIDGVLSLSRDADTALSFTGRTTPGSPAMRAALPPAASAAIAGLELGRPITVESARYVERANPGEAPAIEFDATVRLESNTANLGTPITELRGTLQASARAYADGRPTRLDVALAAPSLRASGRRIEALTAEFTNRSDPAWLSLSSLSGRVYGGMLTGRGGMPLDGDGAYRFSVSVQDASLGPILDPATEPRPDAEPAAALRRDKGTGLVSAELTLAADPQSPATRSGSGTITVRDAKLFAERNSIAVLRALNFALPSRDALTHALIDFTIDGGLLRFRRLEMNGPGLIVQGINGGGTMAWPSTELDLLLTTRNASAPTFGIVTDVLNALKDELIGIAVTGTLENPVAALTTLSGTRRTAGEILEPVLPLSPVSPRSPAVEPSTEATPTEAQ